MPDIQSSSDITPKPGWFKFSTPLSSGSFYSSWRLYLEGESAQPWAAFCQQFAENFQLALLVALSVSGWLPHEWNPIFMCILNGFSPYADLGKQFLLGQSQDPYQYFLEKLTNERAWCPYLPPTCPEWLFRYQYTQQQYLLDLSQVWDNIPDAYYKPWAITRIGHDSPTVARLKLLSREAREEIDQVAWHGGLYIKR